MKQQFIDGSQGTRLRRRKQNVGLKEGRKKERKIDVRIEGWERRKWWSPECQWQVKEERKRKSKKAKRKLWMNEKNIEERIKKGQKGVRDDELMKEK